MNEEVMTDIFLSRSFFTRSHETVPIILLPAPMTRGMMEIPERPAFLNTTSKITATLLKYPLLSRNPSKMNMISMAGMIYNTLQTLFITPSITSDGSHDGLPI